MGHRTIIILAALALSACASHPRPASPRDPCVRWSVYDMAEIVTGAPARTLRGLARAESGERDDIIGDDGESMGRFQWRAKYLSYFREILGPFDPRDPQLSTIRAGQLYMRNLRELGSPARAIAAHNQGPSGVRKHGPNQKYIDRVMEASR